MPRPPRRSHLRPVARRRPRRYVLAAPRRTAQLRRLRDDLDYPPIRGNAGSRLASCGVATSTRSSWPKPDSSASDRSPRQPTRSALTTSCPLPAAGAGIIALQCRDDDTPTRALLAPLDHPATHIEATCERAYFGPFAGTPHCRCRARHVQRPGCVLARPRLLTGRPPCPGSVRDRRQR
ncbi:hypothetical protein [Glycomyces tritici]|uniref:hypothetical protein n=1 Tax=Glycomyces tritici TaxID=2665176 RepID=UPI00338F81ED